MLWSLLQDCPLIIFYHRLVMALVLITVHRSQSGTAGQQLAPDAFGLGAAPVVRRRAARHPAAAVAAPPPAALAPTPAPAPAPTPEQPQR